MPGPSVSSGSTSQRGGAPGNKQSNPQSSSLGSPLMDSSHGTSASTGLGASRRTTDRQSGVQAPDGDKEEEFHSPMGEACSGKRKPKWLQDTLRDATFVAEPKRSVRESRPPERFCSYMAMATSILDSEPSSYEEAASQQVWREAMQEEYSSIMKNDVWEVVPRPEGKSVVTSRWLYKVKHAADGSIEKFKARFVARGFSQVKGVDYEETIAPVARYTSIRSTISIAAKMGWKIHYMDVKTAFLNGFIQEEVYIEQPQGFEVHGKESHVCRLKKALYGLKQAPGAWYSRIDTYLQGMGFTKSEADPNLYYIVIGEEPLILVLYVDEGHRLDALLFGQGDGVRLAGYTDSNWAGCASDRKSTSGYCFWLGSAVVSWFSRKQQSVALSSADAEYMATSLASCEAIKLRKMLFGLFGQPLRPSMIYCDNQSCIKLTENPVFHDRSKHIGIKYHFIRDYVQKGAVKLEYIPTDEQVADILTKALPRASMFTSATRWVW
eukprot:PITA_27400